VNKKDKDEVSPLMFASVWSEPEVVKVLLANGVDVNARTARGLTPLMSAESFNRG